MNYLQCKVTAAYLNSFFFQVHLQCQLFSEHYVRIVCLFESRFQLFQLFFGEYGPMSPLSLGRWTRKYGPGTIMMTASGSVTRHRHGHHVTRIYALVTGRSDWKKKSPMIMKLNNYYAFDLTDEKFNYQLIRVFSWYCLNITKIYMVHIYIHT